MWKFRITFRRLFARLAWCSVVPILFAGCATIIKGSTQPISISSHPLDATVTIHDLRTGQDMSTHTTPYMATLKRGAGYFKGSRYRVTVQKPGYQKTEFMIEGSMNGWYIGGNLIFGGLIGYLIVDPLSGGMYTLAPDKFTADLAELSATSPRDGNLVVVLKDALPELSPSIQSQIKPLHIDPEMTL